MGRFAGKHVFISGAASGFGRLLAERLAAEGARLSLIDMNADALAAFKKSEVLSVSEVFAAQCDVACAAQLSRFIDDAVAALGPLDIAVNNAGIITPPAKLVETEEASFDRLYSVNAKGVFLAMKYQIPHMQRHGGGAILNVSSLAGIGAAPNLSAYAASKHAVIGLTRAAAVEYGKHNIRVNAICPFFSATPLLDGSLSEDKLAGIGATSPMKRLPEPGEVVASMLLLIDPDNTYMNGQAVAIDGGLSAS